MERKLAWIALNALPSLTRRRLDALLSALGSPEGILAASREELLGVLGPEIGARIYGEIQGVDPERELELVRKSGASVVTWEDEDYPRALFELPDPPLVLYVLGEIVPKDERAIAVVGTRRATSYGRIVAKTLSRDLASRGITVVSGMAPGIDTAAHKGALEGGRTIAVLGTGLGKPYPAGNMRLMEEIAARGAVISEFPWEREGSKWTFPRRNRIIAALSLGVVVVEAPARSGALITAEIALELGREVFAVPGPITSEVSRGTNRLIREGAKPVTGPDDILEEFPHLAAPRTPGGAAVKLGPEEEKVYGVLGGEPLTAEEIARRTGLPYPTVARVLVELSLAGMVEEAPGGRFLRAGIG